MPWQRVHAITGAGRAEALAAALEDAGALSVTLLDAADEPLYEPAPGATPLWASTRVEALFEHDFDWERATAMVSARLGLGRAVWRAEPLADADWARVWMDRFAPMRFGRRLWICPTVHTPPAEAEVVVRLDPGLAFGTGTHPTTALCLRALDALPAPGPRVIDYGCGSGVLAVAAALLGATRVAAHDIDPQALVATRDNARANAVDDRVRTQADAAALRPAELVLANILAAPLTELAPRLAALTVAGGRVVLSGILTTQAEALGRCYARWFDMAPAEVEEDWASLTGVRRP